MDAMDTSLKYLIWFAIGGAIFTVLYHIMLWWLLKQDRDRRRQQRLRETDPASCSNPSPSDAADQSEPLLPSPPETV